MFGCQVATSEINTQAYLGELRALAARYQLELDGVEAVLSIQDWCKGRGVPEENPFRTGKIVRNTETGRFLILLLCPITEEMFRSVISAMECRGFAKDAARLSDPGLFMKHLLLHEIAHGLDPSRSEAECDRWAFDQLAAAQPDAPPDAPQAARR